MKFSIGDKIILKQTGEEGTVTDFIGKDMLEVEVKGTHFPVYTDEVDHPYLKWFTEKNKQKKKPLSAPEQLPAEKPKDRIPRLPKGVYLSFMPVFKANEVEDIVEQLKIFLVNETDSGIRFSYDMRVYHQSVFKLNGSLHAFGHLYLHAIEYGMMNDQPRFHWSMEDAENARLKTENGILRIKPSRLFEHVSDLLLKNEPTFSYLLLDDFIEKPREEKKVGIYSPPVRPIIKPNKVTSLSELPRYELDLHIEQLTDDYKGLSNAEIMNIQLHSLQRYLHLAIIHHQERMIVIHGLGTGALRAAVHKILRETPEVSSFKNEFMGKYGFGATEIIFKK